VSSGDMVSVLNVICCTGCLKRNCSSLAAQKALAVGIVAVVLTADLLGVISTLVRYQNLAMRVAVPIVLCYLAANFFSAFFQASFRDAGKCSDTWTNLDRVCTCCYKRKPMRACHCSTCGVCVRKYDHHCPWIGNCVGVFNYPYFFAFLLYTLLIQVLVCVVDIFGICKSNVVLGAISLVAALLVFLGVSYLFFFHCYLLAHNMTTVEYYRVKQERARNPAYRHPYDGGFSANFLQVYPQPWRLLFPCTMPVATDGIWTYDYAEKRDIRIGGITPLTGSLVQAQTSSSHHRPTAPGRQSRTGSRVGEQRLESLVQDSSTQQDSDRRISMGNAGRPAPDSLSRTHHRTNTDLAHPEGMWDRRREDDGSYEDRDARVDSRTSYRPHSGASRVSMAGDGGPERSVQHGTHSGPLSGSQLDRYSDNQSIRPSSRDYEGSWQGRPLSRPSANRPGSSATVSSMGWQTSPSARDGSQRAFPGDQAGRDAQGSRAGLPPRDPGSRNSHDQGRVAERRPERPSSYRGPGRPYSEARELPPLGPEPRRQVSSSRSSRVSSSRTRLSPARQTPRREPSAGLWFGTSLAQSRDEPPTYSPSLGPYVAPALRRPESGSAGRGLDGRETLRHELREERPRIPSGQPPQIPGGRRPRASRAGGSDARRADSSNFSENSEAGWVEGSNSISLEGEYSY